MFSSSEWVCHCLIFTNVTESCADFQRKPRQETPQTWYRTLTMDSFVWAMSVMTPSEMMSRMKYCEPSVTADAYLKIQEKKGGKVSNEPKSQHRVVFLTVCLKLPGCICLGSYFIRIEGLIYTFGRAEKGSLEWWDHSCCFVLRLHLCSLC